MLSQAEFEELIADPSKSIEGDIIWQQERSPWFSFRSEITRPAGYPLSHKGSYNPIIAALSYVIIHRPEGRIYALDMGKDHRNPDGQLVGETHKHRWDESLRDKHAYLPLDITAHATEPEKVWIQFCEEAKLTHNGTMFPLPPRSFTLVL